MTVITTGPHDGQPGYEGPLGRDAQGYLVRRSGGMDYRLTECCQASAKGCDGYTGCRACYRPVDPEIGGMPVAPYRGEGGAVTATRVMGWDAFRALGH